ncbi:DNA-binding transcriptional activator of the SARP family [Mariniphaga anaerophila]|uniref:DNA-binding transcriptional activator of the SARP family n=1 Tax=Mariniphaga anaerophila TaxID=1484053 RepID=A0A1M4SK09_9BACT|nr:kelch repeat-containing protein [Mariniphaga anaerophila]SHE32604.1 DNA-binding transcriptional activator of the SARP family [Mariniphaga anaerophila]
MQRNILYILFLFIICSLSIKGSNKKDVNVKIESGLYFSSHAVSKEKRTELDLTPDDGLRFDNQCELSFDIKLRKEFRNYGYIVRIIVNDSVNVDLISNIWENKPYLSVVVKHHQILKSITDVPLNEWSNISIKLSHENSELDCLFNQIRHKVSAPIPSLDDVKVFFGGNNHQSFFTTDIATMSVRDVKIRDERNKVIRNWTMKKHAYNRVFDEVVYAGAKVKNGIWLSDQHVEWKLEQTFQISTNNPQITFDEETQRIFVTRDEKIYTYYCRTGILDSTYVLEGVPYQSSLNNLIFNPLTNSLLSYNIGHDKLIYYDAKNREWDNNNRDDDKAILHHNRIIAKDRNKLVLFGGYEEYKYSANLYQRSLDGGSWQAIDLSGSIAPRYLASAAYLGNGKILIFGGYGSATGRQEEFPVNYNDLYSINIDSGTVKKLWDIGDGKEHQLYSNSMVVDNEQNCFYTLAYNSGRNHTYAQICRMGIDVPNPKLVADSIPYIFHDTESYIDLYLDKQKKKLYAITSSQKISTPDMLCSQIAIYSLSYPPLLMSDVIQEEPVIQTSHIFVVFGIAALLALIVFLLNRGKKTGTSNLVSLDREKSISSKKKLQIQIKLLGGFQILGIDNKDITGMFTPMQQSVFLYILLNTIKNGKGVTSSQLDNIFWPDMEKRSATNNRSVNIYKLRGGLDKIGDIQLLNTGSYWSMKIGESIRCDFKLAFDLLEKNKEGNLIDDEEMSMLIELGNWGKLLPDMDDEWLDEYKSIYIDRMMDYFYCLSENRKIRADLNLLFSISNVMYQLDDLDEKATELMCYSLYYSGKKLQAKKCFDTFCNSYTAIMNAEPSIKFESIIKK